MTEAAWTWDSIINALGGTGEVAGALGQLLSVVSGWRTRGIPPGHWAAVVAFACESGEPEITLALLAELAARKAEAAKAKRLEEARA